MPVAEKPGREKHTGLLVLLVIIALLLAGVLAALVVLVGRLPPSPGSSEVAPGDDPAEEPPGRATSTESRPEVGETPGRPEPPGTVVVISASRTYERITYETGVFLLSAPTPVYVEPGGSSKVTRILPEGATFVAMGRRGDYRLIRWTEGLESFEGWVLVAPTQALAADRGGIAGAVYLSGRPPVMQVPAKRKNADFCEAKSLVHNAVVVDDGKLRDVLVRIAPGKVPGDWTAPRTPAVLEQRDCVVVPRMQGVMTGQAMDILNADGTLHNVHAYTGVDSTFNQAQPRGAAPITRKMPDEPTVMRFQCDLHPWTRGFVVVTDHPFFAVTDEGGRFAIRGVPPGKYAVEALHSRYGVRRIAEVVVAEGATATADFTFTTDDPRRTSTGEALCRDVSREALPRLFSLSTRSSSYVSSFADLQIVRVVLPVIQFDLLDCPQATVC